MRADLRADGSAEAELSLALVAQQAALHGGSARLEASALGGVRAVMLLESFPGDGVPARTNF